jgi:hypothetical protein
VTFRNGVSQPARFLFDEATADISLLVTRETSFPSLLISDDIYSSAGSKVVALGVTDGEYLTRRGQVLSVAVDNAGWGNIKFNAPVEPGMSGGPLVHGCGYLVGVLSIGGQGKSSYGVAVAYNRTRADDLIGLAKIMELRRPPTPTPPPTPIPFSCTNPSGAAVSGLSYKGMVGGGYIDVLGRVTNTCNQPIEVSMTAVVYAQGDRLLGSAEATENIGGLRLSPGESRVVTITVFGRGYNQTTRVSIETRYVR